MSQSLLTGGGAGGVTGTALVQEAKQINVVKIVSTTNLCGSIARRTGSVCHSKPRNLFVFFIFHRGWTGRVRDGHSECDWIGRRRIYDRRNCRAEKAGALWAAAI